MNKQLKMIALVLTTLTFSSIATARQHRLHCEIKTPGQKTKLYCDNLRKNQYDIGYREIKVHQNFDLILFANLPKLGYAIESYGEVLTSHKVDNLSTGYKFKVSFRNATIKCLLSKEQCNKEQEEKLFPQSFMKNDDGKDAKNSTETKKTVAKFFDELFEYKAQKK